MKQITGIKVHSETSKMLENGKKIYGVPSKEEVIIIQNKILNKYINTEFGKGVQYQIMEENLEEKEPRTYTWGIVPNFVEKEGIQFFSKKHKPISICKKSVYKSIPPFRKAFITVKAFNWEAGDRNEKIKFMEYEELEKLGFGIYKLRLNKGQGWFKHQRKKYNLYRLNSPIPFSIHLGYLPRNYVLQKDINNKKIRLIGEGTNPSGKSKWFYIDKNKSGGHPPSERNHNPHNPFRRPIGTTNPPAGMSSDELQYRAIGYIDTDKKWKNITIESIPIMITEDNQLLCIPNSKEAKTIGVLGKTGSCKSLLLNSLLFWEHFLLKRSCVNLNDFQSQTQFQSFKSKSFKHMRAKINAQPYPLPIVYLYPSSQNLQVLKKDKKFPHLTIALPIKELISNIKYYYKLDRSAVYLENLEEELLKCDTFEELINVIEENIPEKQNKAMRFKLISILKALDNSKISDVSNIDSHAYLRLKNNEIEGYNNLALISILRAGLIPSLQTSTLWTENHFAPYMAFLINSIYSNQDGNDLYFRNKMVPLYIDEIHRLWENQEGGDLIKKSLNQVSTNGRAYRLPLRYSSQHYNKLTTQIKANTKYLFISKINDDSEIRSIAKDFDIPKLMRKEIPKLIVEPNREIFELIAATSENKGFLLIDLENGKHTFTSEPQKGRLIPSPADHYHPK